MLVWQERKILQKELTELKRRLHKAEHDLLNAKEECLHLTNNTSALEREVFLQSFNSCVCCATEH